MCVYVSVLICDRVYERLSHVFFLFLKLCRSPCLYPHFSSTNFIFPHFLLVLCPSTLYFAHATASCTVRTFGAQCTPTCDAGYVAVGGSPVFTCGSRATWVPSSSSFRCAPVDCPDTIADLTPHQSADCSGNNTYFEGERCQVKCDTGYVRTSGNDLYSCKSDGTWSGNLTCAVRDCGSAIPNLGFGAEAFCANTNFGSTCSATCSSGFTQIDGTGLYVCDEQGFWQGSLTCVPTDCGPFSAPTLHSTLAAPCTNTLYGSSCAAACDSGYTRLQSSATFRCGASGWSGSLVCEGKLEKRKERKK